MFNKKRSKVYLMNMSAKFFFEYFPHTTTIHSMSC